jgi:hypothetical protein
MLRISPRFILPLVVLLLCWTGVQAQSFFVATPPSFTFNNLSPNQNRANLGLSQATFRVIEGTPTLQINVLRGGDATGVGTITVDYATSNGTAQGGQDYTSVSGTLEFPEGTNSRTITIAILDDQAREGAEQFSLTLSNPTGAADLVSPTSAVITIADNEVMIYTETGTDRAVALNAIHLVSQPFGLRTEPNLSADTRTRVALFVEDLQINQGFPPIVVTAMDAQQRQFQIPLEVVAIFTNAPFSQLVVRLPETLPAGDLFLRVSVNGVASNLARITIKPQ